LIFIFVTVQGHVSSCQKELYVTWPKRTSARTIIVLIHEKKILFFAKRPQSYTKL